MKLLSIFYKLRIIVRWRPQDGRSTGPKRPWSLTMPAAQQSQQNDDLSRITHDTMLELIREQVVYSLGTPDDLLWVQVRQLWADRYRVNVVVGKDATSARVAKSYFLVTDGDGNIL